MSAIYKALQSKSSKETSEKTKHINRQRLLVISSRGITYRHRHLIQDLLALLPHARKEPKFDSKKNLHQLNEKTSRFIFMDFKTTKWTNFKISYSKFTYLDELNFTGNCLKGSRPILSFDKSFLENDHYKLLKEMFLQTFGVPPNARKSKPFIDHVMTFSIVDGKIWIRNYQINETLDVKENDKIEDDEDYDVDQLNLVEIGPRLVLTLITVLEGSFSGPKIYENKQYVSPNFVRAQLKQQAADQAKSRSQAALERKIKKRNQVLKADPLSNDALFK
ncbi:Brix domain family protein [Candida albicans]|uniref:Brix domain family protein n=2 Tax=Candida albicans TaxID=5476 RepID=A0A8H6BYW2_CANAX|nr:Brix domain family protein [Candida albicans]